MGRMEDGQLANLPFPGAMSGAGSAGARETQPDSKTPAPNSTAWHRQLLFAAARVVCTAVIMVSAADTWKENPQHCRQRLAESESDARSIATVRRGHID